MIGSLRDGVVAASTTSDSPVYLMQQSFEDSATSVVIGGTFATSVVFDDVYAQSTPMKSIGHHWWIGAEVTGVQWPVVTYMSWVTPPASNSKSLDARWDALSSVCSLIYDLEADAKGRDAAMFVGYFVQRTFSQRNIEAVNSLIASIAVEKLTRWSMIALLRATASAKTVLPAWKPFLEVVKTKLADDPDAERLMMGLR